MDHLPRRLVLASASEFRAKILSEAGIPFTVSVPELDETIIVGDNPREIATRRATAKAMATAKGQIHSITLGCDQTLGLGDELFHKPKDRDDARDHLRKLQGKTHVLYSAFTLIHSGKVTDQPRIIAARVVECPMTMLPLDDAAIERHLNSNEWQGCVGCYRIEGRGILLMESVGGSTHAIMGLPLLEVLEELRTVAVTFF
jgi:septum formation protein